MNEPTEPPLIRLAVILKEMRLDSGWSEAALARRADLPTQVIRDYEADPSKLTCDVGEKVVMQLHPEKIHEWQLKRALREQECSEPGMPPPEVIDQMEASMLEIKAAFHIDAREFREALTVLDHALDLEERPERTGRLLLGKAAALGEFGREAQALQVLQEAEQCFDSRTRRTLWLRLRLDQMYYFCYAERFKDAGALISEALELAEDVGTPANRREASWLAGRALAGLGKLDQALEALREARDAYLANGYVFEGLSATLDIAAVLTAKGEPTRVEEIAKELQSLAQDKKLNDASRSTLKLFCKMAGRLTPERARRFAGDFRKSDTRLTRPYLIPA